MNRRKGFSLVEVLMVTAIFSLIIAATASVTMGLGRSFSRYSAQLDADESASYSVQSMTRDLQEAKQVAIISPTNLKIYFPLKNEDGTYTRTILATDTAVSYFRGNADGVADVGGDCLIRSPVNGKPHVVCKGVNAVNFESWNPSSVDITLGVHRYSAAGNQSCDMVHRAIFLRNF